MAGIGFKLQNLLKSESFINGIKAYSYAAIISSGPWIYSLLSFLAVSFFVTSEAEVSRIFQISVIYVFAFSQIIAGAFQLVATRIIADYIYEDRLEMIPVVYFNTMICLAPLLAIFAYFIFSSAGIGMAYSLVTSALFVITGLIWIQLIILTACRDFKTISYRFAIGFLISISVSLALGSRFGLMLYFAGFTAGMLYIFLSLNNQISREFSTKEGSHELYSDRSKISKYSTLFAVGFLFNLGAWADKLVYWYAGGGRQVTGLLYENSVYDRMNLILILMLIPVMALFTISVETNFYVKFRNFYKSIIEKENLESIEENLSLMKLSILKGAAAILKMVAPICFIIIVFSSQIMGALKLPPDFRTNWCIFAVAASIHAFFMLSLILLMYFDFLNHAFVSTAVFCAANIGFNLAFSYFYGAHSMGYGYLAAITIGFITASYYLKSSLKDLIYHTFARERIPGEIIVEI